MPWFNAQQNLVSNIDSVVFLPFVVPLIIWSLIWKGMALYRAARREDKVWFVIFLIANTVGILEIVYLLFFSNSGKKSPKRGK